MLGSINRKSGKIQSLGVIFSRCVHVLVLTLWHVCNMTFLFFLLVQYNDLLLVSPTRGFSGLILQYFCGGLKPDCLLCSLQLIFMEVKDAPVQLRLDHNTGDYVPYSYRTVSGFFNVPYYLISNKGTYMRRDLRFTVPFPRRLESLTVCRCTCNYKGSTFSSVILRP